MKKEKRKKKEIKKGKSRWIWVDGSLSNRECKYPISFPLFPVDSSAMNLIHIDAW